MRRLAAVSRFGSLRWRLLFPLASMWALLALIALVGVDLEAWRRLEASLERRAETVANLVTYGAETVSSVSDLQRFVSKAAAEPNVRLIVVAGGRPARVVASSHGAWAGQLVSELPPSIGIEELRETIEAGVVEKTFHDDEHHYDYAVPLLPSLATLEGGTLAHGAIVLQLDTRTLQADLQRSMWRWMAGIVLAATVFMVVGYRVVRRRVLRPLGSVAEAIRAGQEHEDAAWALTNTGDELGVLAGALRRSLLARQQADEGRRLAERLASVGSLAGGVAHEINTPLQFVNDSVHFVREAAEDLLGATLTAREVALALPDDAPPAEVRGALARIATALDGADLDYLADRVPQALRRSEDGVSRVRSIVHSLQACADESSHALQPEDLNRTVKNAVTVIERSSPFAGRIDAEFGELPAVVCHAGAVYDAVLQVLQNAVEAVSRRHGRAASGAEAPGRIVVRTWRDGGDAVVTIADNGDGITADIAGRVFDPFFTTKAVGLGRGQGLAVAWRAVTDTHGGRLTFDSRPDAGTTFTIRLPIDNPGTLRSHAA